MAKDLTKQRKQSRTGWFLLCLLGTATCTSKPVSKPSAADDGKGCKERDTLPIPADLKSKVRLAIAVGQQLYVQDIASAIGTDVLLANAGADEREEVSGYLTIRDGSADGQPLPSWTVSFYTADEPPLIKYRIRVPMDPAPKPSLERVIPPKPASGTMLALIRARTKAIKSSGPFFQPINPAVLPAGELGEGDDILVELLAGTQKPDTVVLGKHIRVLVSADGKQIKSVTPLSKGALEFTRHLPDGGQAAALYATQIVTDYPVETHVFASLSSKLPLYLVTSRGVWKVDGDSVCLIRSADKTGAPMEKR